MLPYTYLLLIAIPFIGAALIPLVGHFFPKARAWFAVACAALSAAIIISMIPDVWNIINTVGGYAPTYTLLWNDAIGLNLDFYIDALGLLLALIATIIGLLVVIYSVKYMETDEKKYNLSRYYSLVLLFIGAMVCLVLTDNLLVLYFFWEIVGLCSYALIGYYYDDPKAAKAGMKAFVTTRVGDTFLLIGIVVLYWQTKSFSIQEIISAVGNGGISMSSLALPGACFILGAIGKSAQVPLHVWLPDAMEAPTPISALIHAATMVNAGIYLILRVMPIFSEVQYWLLAVGIIGGVTMLMTAIQALVEIDLKRLLAYSTISQLAYLMLAASFGVTYGLFSSSFHLLVHGTFKALLFLCAGAIIHSVGSKSMMDMGGLKNKMRYTFWMTMFGAFALAGIPPFGGFWSKDLIFASALKTSHYLFFIIATFTALLTLLYTLRMIYLVFYRKRDDEVEAHDPSIIMLIPLFILGIGALTLGFFEHTFLHFFTNSNMHVEVVEGMEYFVSVGASITIMLIGFLIFRYYVHNRDKLITLSKSGITSSLYNIASNGFYFDRFYLWLIGGLLATGRTVYHKFDIGATDKFCYETVAGGTKNLGQKFRHAQTGDLNYNMVGIAIGAILVTILILIGGV